MAKRRSFKRKSFRKKRFNVKRRKGSFKKLIRREISRAQEKKTVQEFEQSRILHTTGSSDFPTQNIFPLGIYSTSLEIPQGVGQGNRIGNRITIKNLQFKGCFVQRPFDSVFNDLPQPLMVKMWIFYDRDAPTDLPNPTASGDWFQAGNSDTDLSGRLTDMWAPVNTDRYRVLTSRTFKVGNAVYGGNPGVGGSGYGDRQFYANNDFPMFKRFSINLTKYLIKTVKFDDNVLTPTTRGLFAMVEYVPATGQAAAPERRSLDLSFIQTVKFVDA